VLAELRQNHDREIAQLKRDQATEIERLQAEHQTAAQRINSEIEKIRARFESESQDKIAAFKARGDQQLNGVQKKHAARVSELNATYKRELEQLRAAHRANVEMMRTKHKEKLQEIRARADQHLAAQRMKAQPQQVPPPDLDLDRKRRELADDIAKITARHSQIVTDKKAELQQELHRVQLDHARAIEVARTECEAEIRNYRGQVERQKNQVLSSAREGTRVDTEHRVIVMNRVFSLRPQAHGERLRVKLRISRSDGLSVFDDEPFEWVMTGLVAVVDIPVAESLRPSDELELTFTERKKKDMPSIQAFEVPDSEEDGMKIERPQDFGHQDIKKVQTGIEATSDRVFTRMKSAFDDLADHCRDFRTFIETEHRKLGKTVTEFRQRNRDSSRAIHQSMSEMQQVYQSALTSLAAARTSSELATQVVHPLSYHVVANSYAVPHHRSASARGRADRH
jgi:hypothetical protein